MKTARLPQIREVRRLYTGSGRYTKGDTNRHAVYIAVVPEQIEVKELWSNANQLYLPVALTKITPEVVEAPAVRKAKVPAPLFSGDTISLLSLVGNVNPLKGCTSCMVKTDTEKNAVLDRMVELL